MTMKAAKSFGGKRSLAAMEPNQTRILLLGKLRKSDNETPSSANYQAYKYHCLKGLEKVKIAQDQVVSVGDGFFYETTHDSQVRIGHEAPPRIFKRGWVYDRPSKCRRIPVAIVRCGSSRGTRNERFNRAFGHSIRKEGHRSTELCSSADDAGYFATYGAGASAGAQRKFDESCHVGRIRPGAINGILCSRPEYERGVPPTFESCGRRRINMGTGDG